MATQAVLTSQTMELEDQRESLIKQLENLNETKQQLTAEKKKMEHVLRDLKAYVGDCFPQNSSLDEDWQGGGGGVVRNLYADALGLALDLALVERDIRDVESQLESVMQQLSLCTRATIEARTYCSR